MVGGIYVKLKDKVCIVTGGAKGIGEATVKLFRQEGARVAVVDIDEPKGAALARELDGSGDSVIFVKCDVSKSAEVRTMVEKVKSKFNSIDVLVNSAGVTDDATVVTTLEENWNKVIGVNLTGIYLCCKEVIPVMIDQGGGNVVNIASIASFVGLNNNAAYNASKGGALMLTRNMAVDFASKNIRVNAVCPAMIMTPMLEDFIKIQPDPEAYVKGVEASTPLGRMGTSEEVAHAALFFAADDCRYATGSALMVDGGYTAK